MGKRYRAEDFIREHHRRGGGARQSVVRVLGDTLDRHGPAFRKEHLEFEDAHGPRVVDVVETNLCSFGHTIDDKVRVAGTCQMPGCNAVLCSTAGCLFVCSRCGAVCCRRHSIVSGDKAYCSSPSCRWLYYWRLFWRLD